MRISKGEKELLQQAFETPAPKKKRAFLRALPKQEAGLGALILSQAAYIRAWVWAVSLLLFGLVVSLARYVEVDIIWVLSSVMPFAALLLIREVARSSAYGMAELEMTARFSLRTILLARMSMLGAAQLAGLLLCSTVAGMMGTEKAGINGALFLQYSVYLLVPYLLTSVLGLVAVRRLPGKEGLYVCGSISAFVCALCPLSRYFVPVLYEAESFALWALAAVLLAVGLVKEYGKTMNRWEEIVWN